jgi:hypothetical protein
VRELLWLLFAALQAIARPHQDLALENLLLRHQLAVLTRPTRSRPRARLRIWDKLLWILARRFCPGWREHLAFVTPETVVRWHRQGWRLFWRWKSRSRGGRPHLSLEVRDLIATASRDNRLWGTERIRGELLKLGISVSNRSIRRYRWRGPGCSPTQTWRTFLRNHAHHLWAADLLTVPTLTFKTPVHLGIHRAWPPRGGACQSDGQPDRSLANHAICSAITMPSTAAISESAPAASASMRLPRQSTRLRPTPSQNALLARSAESVSTT